MAQIRTADATWQGDLISGSGTIDYVGSGAFSRMPVSWHARTEASDGQTSPEELLAAAHASCFSMALSVPAGQGRPPGGEAVGPRHRHLRQGRRRLEGRLERAPRPGRRARHVGHRLPRPGRGRQGQLPHLAGPQGQRGPVRGGVTGRLNGPIRAIHSGHQRRRGTDGHQHRDRTEDVHRRPVGGRIRRRLDRRAQPGHRRARGPCPRGHPGGRRPGGRRRAAGLR